MSIIFLFSLLFTILVLIQTETLHMMRKRKLPYEVLSAHASGEKREHCLTDLALCSGHMTTLWPMTVSGVVACSEWRDPPESPGVSGGMM